MFEKCLMIGSVLLTLARAGPVLAQEARMELTSPAFQDGHSIPTVYTCDGKNISPPLKWSGSPAGTKSFALIVDDPDAPRGIWVHWVLWNLPAAATELKEALSTLPYLPSGALQGKNDSGDIGYSGPCPPSGTHRYFFKLYALDTVLSLKSSVTKSDLEAAMKDHHLAQATLIGVYSRK